MINEVNEMPTVFYKTIIFSVQWSRNTMIRKFPVIHQMTQIRQRSNVLNYVTLFKIVPMDGMNCNAVSSLRDTNFPMYTNMANIKIDVKTPQVYKQDKPH